MRQVVHNQLVYYQFPQWAELKHGIFTRKGGTSQTPWDSLNVGGTLGDDVEAVHKNHALMYEALNVNSKRACTVWMVHGNEVVLVNDPVNGRRWIAKADAMITHKLDTPLVMRYADCTPIMFFDRVKQVIGIAHAGWRGTVKGIGARTVQAMVQAYGSKPSDIEAGIGPCIGPDRYQVGEEVVSAIQDHYGTTDELIRRDPADGTAYLNLWRANELDLERAGVEKIYISGICTAENTNEFYSHRAEKGKTGRFGTIISL